MPDSALIPTFYGWILYQSRVNPHASAVSFEAKETDYRTFCRDIEKVTRRLHRLGMPRTARVAVHIQNSYLRWLVNIALARIGVMSVATSGAARELDFLKAQFVVSDRPADVAGRDAIEASFQWLDSEADAWPPFEDLQHEHDTPCRMVVSSGTTGTPKKAVLTHGSIRNRSRGTARAYGLNSSARLMTTMSSATIGGFMMPVACWSSGGAVLLVDVVPGQRMTDLLLSKPNVMMLSTAQLGGALETLPNDYWPWQHLVIYVAGSSLPRALNRAVRSRLTQSLFIIYGSTEAGSVTLGHASRAEDKPGFTGYVLPTAQVEIVDEQGARLPPGKIGEIRIRSDGLVEGYADEPGITDEAFRDGWFYPGDAGMLDDENGLSVMGRTRELMNLGGSKIAPEVIEEALAGCPGMRDLAVFALRQAGTDRPWAAVVPDSNFTDAALVKLFAKVFPKLPSLSVARMEQIPRNEMGKVLRAHLGAMVQNAVKRTEAQAAQAGKADPSA
ncbi:MAG: hypothetical protein JWQ07_2951 [Ramlibacter sp.]|nr:hypothetical protein [Ramlibacter sp.]